MFIGNQLIAEERVGTDHFNNLRVDGLGENTSTCGNVVDKVVEGAALDLLALEVCHRVHEVELHAALPQLAHEQILLLHRRHICKTRLGEIIFCVRLCVSSAEKAT